MDLGKFKKEAERLKKENKIFFNKLKAKKPSNLDSTFHTEHEEVFINTNCLECANCCKTTSPIFYQKDIEKAAKATNLKPGSFIEKYLRIDTDNDYVFKSAPCPFLNSDNYCVIYKSRPNACKEYPHTNRKKMAQILDLTFENTMVCPAVLKITENVKKQLGV